MLTEEPLVGPAAGDEGVFRYYYYTPTYITVDNGWTLSNHGSTQYHVLVSIPYMDTASYNADGKLSALCLYLILTRANRPITWDTLELAQVVVDLETNEKEAVLFGENYEVIPLGEAQNFGCEGIIYDGLETFTNLATGVQEVR
jgi:hypothetical protein